MNCKYCGSFGDDPRKNCTSCGAAALEAFDQAKFETPQQAAMPQPQPAPVRPKGKEGTLLLVGLPVLLLGLGIWEFVHMDIGMILMLAVGNRLGRHRRSVALLAPPQRPRRKVKRQSAVACGHPCVFDWPGCLGICAF